MRPWSAGGALVALALLAIFANEARAEARARLDFMSAGASCPGVLAMRVAVKKRLGYDPFVEGAALSVRVELRELKGRLLGEARFERSGQAVGRRAMKADRGACPELVESLALAISLALDPDAVERPRTPQGARRDRELTTARIGLRRLPLVTVNAPQLAASVGDPRAVEWTHRGELGLWGRVGSSPESALGLALGWFGSGTRLGVGLGLRARLPSSGQVSDIRLETYGVAAAGRACLLGDGLEACLLMEMGAEHAQGEGLSDPDGAWSDAAAAGAQAVVELVRRDDWNVSAVAELLVPIIRQSYRADGRRLWESPAAGVAAGLRAGWSAR